MATARLVLEQLDSRINPTEFRWNPLSSNQLLWSIGSNWEGWDGRAWLRSPNTVYPTVNDDVAFDAAGANKVCVLDVAGGVTVNSVDVSGGYTGQIMLQNPLTISDTKAASSVKANILTFGSPAATIGGYSAGPGSAVSHGDIYLPSGSATAGGMLWFGGNLADVTVHIGRASANVFAGVTVAGTAAKTMNGSAFSVDGRLNWSGGSVSVMSTPVSSITINEDGIFNVTSGVGTWGVTAGVPTTTFGIINNGVTTVQTNATFNAEFTNTANLYVGPYASATLTVGGTARQTASAAYTVFGSADGQSVGTIELNGPGEVYAVEQGWIGGLGIIDGNLTLGSAYLRAGPEDVFGNFSVADSLVCSGQSVVEVAVGDNHQISQLVVGQQAELGGSLVINWATTQAPSRVEHVLVYIAGQRCGEFSDFAENDRVVNRGVRFKTTYLGGTGNDVALIPLMDIRGFVWEDRNHNKMFNSFNPLDPNGWRNEDVYWYPYLIYCYEGVGITVTLTGDKLPAPLTYFTASDYVFPDLPVGNYTLTFTAPAGNTYDPSYPWMYIPAGYTNTNIPGYIGQSVVEIDVTDPTTDTVYVADVGFAMPKMRVTIAGFAYTDPANEPDPGNIAALNGEFELLYVPGGSDMQWMVAFPPTDPRYGVFIMLTVSDDGVFVTVSRTGTPVSETYFACAFDLETNTTVARPPGPAHPRYTAPASLVFRPIFPEEDS